MCPWPRIQGAMFDADSLLVTYRGFRGEPRGKHKKGQSWVGRGDCIDCNQCVAVCPMGIDIRNGPQLECIQCSLCIDACDEIMDQVGRPRKLVAYDSYRNLEAESHGDRVPIRIIRPRTILYATMLAIVTAIMILAFSRKTILDVNVVADRNPLFVQLSDGSIRNGYTVRILNKLYQTRNYSIRIEGIPDARLVIVGQENVAQPKIDVAPDDLKAVRLFVSVPATTKFDKGQTKLSFIVRDLSDSTETRRDTNFRGPDQ
jgi:cytochrome c oxidase accessory protein FixG